jgi:hypothetical protein
MREKKIRRDDALLPAGLSLRLKAGTISTAGIAAMRRMTGNPDGGLRKKIAILSCGQSG